MSNEQMETLIAEAFTTTNQATTNSELTLVFNLVHVGQVRIGELHGGVVELQDHCVGCAADTAVHVLQASCCPKAARKVSVSVL